jgi:hypothetical protein
MDDPRTHEFRIRYTRPRKDATPARWRDDIAAFGQWLGNRVVEHSAGKLWIPRAPLLLVLLLFSWRHLQDPAYQSLFGGLNLGIHEAGHLFLGWFGSELLAALGGTVFQLAAPLATAVMFYRQRDFFAITVAVFWLGDNLASIAPYVADARWQVLELVSPVSGNPDHDWNTILGTLGLLGQDQLLAGLFRWSGLLVMAAGLVGGAAVLRVMATATRPRR